MYLLGPMTGYPGDNRHTFKAVTIELRRQGFEVVSPDELDTDHPAAGNSWRDYMARDLPYLVTCDAGVALPGWEKSTGAQLEVLNLTKLGKPVYAWPSLDMIPEDRLPRVVVPS